MKVTHANPVYLIHGGASEDYILPGLLPNLKGVILLDADSFQPTAYKISKAIQSLFKQNFPICLSEARAVNPFPYPWRGECLTVKNLPSLQVDSEGDPGENGEECLIRLLEQEKEDSVTLLVTGPWTPIKKVLKKQPTLSNKIAQMVCMGGTFSQEGNIFQDVVGGLKKTHAEWNIFWDPKAVSWVLNNTKFKITMIPVEACDSLKMTPEFYSHLKTQAEQSKLSKLALEIYDIAFKEPVYRFWNTATVLTLLNSRLVVEKTTESIKVITDRFSEKEGALLHTHQGRRVEIVQKISEDIFYRTLLDSLK